MCSRLVARGKALAVANGLMAGLHPYAAEIDDEVLAACQGADVVVSGFLAEGRAAVVAEHLGAPLVLVHTVPARRTDAIPFPPVAAPSFPGVNYLVWAAGEQAYWHRVKPEINLLRRRLGLATTRKPTARRSADQGALELQAYSPALVPGLERWPSRRPVIGALELGAEERRRLGEGPCRQTWTPGSPTGSRPRTSASGACRCLTPSGPSTWSAGYRRR